MGNALNWATLNRLSPEDSLDSRRYRIDRIDSDGTSLWDEEFVSDKVSTGPQRQWGPLARMLNERPR